MLASVAQELAALRQPRKRTGELELPSGKVRMTVTDAPRETLDVANAVEKVVTALASSPGSKRQQ